ncbi:unnamed protein product [Oppiella nova]|uniref:Uncharacterized protein n=1 Tax=Oppiella nova TaxID=334625 RepID=A0A7R9QBL1_9ACAR|nr:unnamed protein product [Oppiella nova]CAG2162656.1 unnamed protein product [Oppiella nova]
MAEKWTQTWDPITESNAKKVKIGVNLTVGLNNELVDKSKDITIDNKSNWKRSIDKDLDQLTENIDECEQLLNQLSCGVKDIIIDKANDNQSGSPSDENLIDVKEKAIDKNNNQKSGKCDDKSYKEVLIELAFETPIDISLTQGSDSPKSTPSDQIPQSVLQLSMDLIEEKRKQKTVILNEEKSVPIYGCDECVKTVAEETGQQLALNGSKKNVGNWFRRLVGKKDNKSGKGSDRHWKSVRQMDDTEIKALVDQHREIHLEILRLMTRLYTTTRCPEMMKWLDVKDCE